MKIKKLNEDIQHCWFGYYIDKDGNQKYFYMTKDSTSKDPDEASDIMEDSIPEPFTKFVFQGSVANTQAEKQGWKLVESSNSELEMCKQNYEKAKADFENYGEEDNNDVLSREEKMLIAKAELDKVCNINENINVGDTVKVSTPGNNYYDGRTGIVDYNEDDIVTVKFDDDKSPKMNNFDLNQIIRIDESKSVNNGIEVSTIADYITDNYIFETIDDKYSCIDSIRDSFKDEKTISKEELEQFIGSHNGKDNELKESLNEALSPREGDRVQMDFYAKDNNGATGTCTGRVGELCFIEWDDGTKSKEIKGYLKVIERPNMNEASYGGAFDIADDQIFTREDIDNLAEEVLNHINETYDYKFDISAAYIDGNELEVGVENDELGEYMTTLKIDMRKVKEPWHLKRVYAFEVASDLINQISTSLNNLGENLTESIMSNQPEGVSEEEYLKSLIGTSVEYANKYMLRGKEKHKGVITGIKNNNGNIYATVHWEFDETIRPSSLEPLGSITYIEPTISTHGPRNTSTNESTERLTESDTEGAKPIETGAAVGMATILSDLIKDEYEAIDGYNTAIATAEAEGFGDMVKVLTDIQAEENIHVGQLQELMKMVDPNASKVEDGTVEAEELLSNPSVNDDDDFDFEDIDESFDVSEDDIADEDVDATIKAVEEAMKEPNKEEIDLTNANFELEDDDEVIVESTEPWEDIYNSFKDIEVQLNGDGEAITATIDRIYNDNKGNPDFEKAYKKWAANE